MSIVDSFNSFEAEQMHHYIVYHSVKKMGTTFRDGKSRPGKYGIVTRKRANNLVGNTVWVISGDGTPCDYRLELRFKVSGIKRIEDDDFATRVFGTEGASFSTVEIRINEKPWFKAFHKTQFFSLGLQRLHQETAEHFLSARSYVSGRDVSKFRRTARFRSKGKAIHCTRGAHHSRYVDYGGG